MNFFKHPQRSLLVTAVAWVVLFVAQAGYAQKFTIVYSFGAKGGGAIAPQAGVILDTKGNFYGTASAGGSFGYGAIFKINSTGTEKLLHSLAGLDGFRPQSSVLRIPNTGTIYATAPQGGTPEGGGCRFGCGALLQLDVAGKETLLHAFTGHTDGGNPGAVLVRDEAGNVYGTTLGGGTRGFGTVFTVDSSGSQTVLYSFTGGAAGGGPNGLVQDSAGNFYGTTQFGGETQFCCGTVFQVDATGHEKVLYSFNGTDGSTPEAGVIRDQAGNLYSTTTMGGANFQGEVFKLDPAGKLTVLHTFGGSDGQYPVTGLVLDDSGNLYGTTNAGGAHGLGTIFRIDTKGNETVLYSFTGGNDGIRPSGLTLDAAGNLYGTTQTGGTYRKGNIFKLTP
jgi:uncharacterized repeat protein (TIGR03803 family)